jgi:hypothetical protein
MESKSLVAISKRYIVHLDFDLGWEGSLFVDCQLLIGTDSDDQKHRLRA